jgi:hypothetical protein
LLTINRAAIEARASRAATLVSVPPCAGRRAEQTDPLGAVQQRTPQRRLAGDHLHAAEGPTGRRGVDGQPVLGVVQLDEMFLAQVRDVGDDLGEADLRRVACEETAEGPSKVARWLASNSPTSIMPRNRTRPWPSGYPRIRLLIGKRGDWGRRSRVFQAP